MSILTPATAADLQRLLPMVEAYHAHAGIGSTGDSRRAGIQGLLTGTPLGAIWMIGPKMAPVGYVAIGLGWSIEMGGPDAFVDELYIRAAVRGRGMGGQALDALWAECRARGVLALHLEVSSANDAARRFYLRKGFAARDGYHLMTRLA